MSRTLRELFVDRTRQLDAFRRMMEAQTPRRIMIMTAGPGMGKSWVIRTYAQQAKERGLPIAMFDFSDGLAYDALGLVTRSRDMLGAEHFGRVTQAILEATTPRVNLNLENIPTDRVDVNLSGATISGGVTVNQGAVNITGNQFNIQTSDPLIRRAIEDRINTVFFEDLAALAQTTRPIFLFDTYDRLIDEERDWTSSAVNRWVVVDLLGRIRDSRLPNTIVVIAGRSAPEFGIEWNEVLGRIQLEPLTRDDVRVYLRDRRGLGIITDAELERLSQASGGNPSVLGIIGDNLEQANRPMTDDEW